MLLALAQTFGLRLKPVVLPDWTSTLQAARERRVDIVMTLGVTAERMEYLAFTLGATPLPGALFARTGERVDPAHATFALERDYMEGLRFVPFRGGIAWQNRWELELEQEGAVAGSGCRRSPVSAWSFCME